jgi:hypothetical protein
MNLGATKLLFSCYLGSFPVAKVSGREIVDSSLSSVEVKNKWSYTTIPLICLHSMDRNNFTLHTFYQEEGLIIPM